MPERMSARRRLAFAAGAPGFLAIDCVVSGILLYFYPLSRLSVRPHPLRAGIEPHLPRSAVPGGPHDSWNLTVAFVALGAMGLPMAGVSVLPNVLLGQLIDDDARRTGTNRSAVFLGVVRAFDKWAHGLAAAVIAFLFARFGKAPAEPLGVLLVGPIGGVAGLLSALLFTRFPNVRAAGGVAESETRARGR
jgi:Na+/melibiose symporter-like transporter